MREIKFRAWDTRKNEWLSADEIMERVLVNPSWEGKTFQLDEKSEKGFAKNIGHSFELMQYTGQKDTEGKEIFEGDKLFAKGNFEDSDFQYVGTVEWSDDDSKFRVSSFHGSFEYIPSGCVVMGNKYEEFKVLDVEPSI